VAGHDKEDGHRNSGKDVKKICQDGSEVKENNQDPTKDSHDGD
jgi:hypothetical protein